MYRRPKTHFPRPKHNILVCFSLSQHTILDTISHNLYLPELELKGLTTTLDISFMCILLP